MILVLHQLQGFTESFNLMRTRDFGAGLVSRESRASALISTTALLLVEAADPMSVIYVCLQYTSREMHGK